MTARLRRLWKQRVAAIAISALVLVPALLAGHRHEGPSSPASSSCAVCVSTAHSPATVTAALSVTSIMLPPRPIDIAIAAAPAHVFQRPATGRAPPTVTTELA